MNDTAQSSATTSDSEFDEHGDLTAEEDDDEEDSIAPEEDVADEEEVNSLVKESQMSLEELLASYGVSTSGLNIIGPGSLGNTGRARSSRSALRRSAGSAAATNTTDESVAPEESVKSRSTSPATKRNRRTTASPSTASAQHKQEATPDPNHTVPGSRRGAAKVAVTGASLELHVTTSSMDVLSDGSPSDSVAKLSTPRSRTTSPATNAPHADQQETPSPQRSSGRRTFSASDKPVATTHTVTEFAQSPCSSAAAAPAPSSVNPSTVPVSVAPPATTSAGEPAPTPNANAPDEMTSSSSVVEASCPITASEMEGDESRDSTREDNYSSRFWQRVIGAGESPPSYNSDEDEDYAPSVESGHDWRGEIRVGDEHQAFVPPFHPHPPGEVTDWWWWDTRRFELESSLLWQPSKIPEQDVIRFERLFAQTVMFPLPSERTVDDEEALFMLMRCNYDPDEALQRMRFRTVSPAEIPGYMESWSEADAVAFEKGFALYNKDFKQIRDTRLRHKTVGELVHYYYLWKKSARHDEFARAYRRDRRKSPHPSMTDFMDCLVLEQEATAEAYLCHLNNTNNNGESNVGVFHLVNHHRLSPAQQRNESGLGHMHEPSHTTTSRYLSHPDPHHTSTDFGRASNKPAFHSSTHHGSDGATPTSRETGRDKVNLVTATSITTAVRPSDSTIQSSGRGTAGSAARATSVSV